MTARTTNNDPPFELTDKQTWETLPGVSAAFSLAKKFQSKGFIAVEYHRKSLPEQTIISPISAIGIGQDLLDDLVVVEGVRVGMEWRKEEVLGWGTEAIKLAFMWPWLATTGRHASTTQQPATFGQ